MRFTEHEMVFLIVLQRNDVFGIPLNSGHRKVTKRKLKKL